MKREIKFRAWDKMDRVMRDCVSMIDGRVFDENLEPQFGLPEFAVEIMQYTGLKDKHGEDVYEGDILEGLNGSKDALVVQFQDGCFKVCRKPESGALGIPESTVALHVRLNGGKAVIGNVYENPELLA